MRVTTNIGPDFRKNARNKKKIHTHTHTKTLTMPTNKQTKRDLLAVSCAPVVARLRRRAAVYARRHQSIVRRRVLERSPNLYFFSTTVNNEEKFSCVKSKKVFCDDFFFHRIALLQQLLETEIYIKKHIFTYVKTETNQVSNSNHHLRCVARRAARDERATNAIEPTKQHELDNENDDFTEQEPCDYHKKKNKLNNHKH